jgi:hypothetical protein
MADKTGKEDTAALLALLLDKTDEGSREVIKLSLMQDVLRLFRVQGTAKDDFVVDIQERLGVNDEQVQFFLENLQNEADIIAKRLTTKEIRKNTEATVEKAASLHIPVQALYLSGGGKKNFVAQYILGVLFLPWMAFGALLAFNGIKKVVEDKAQPVALFHSLIRSHQKVLSVLIGDLNGIIVADLSQIALLASCIAGTNERIENLQKETVIAKLPRKLDKVRFDGLTKKSGHTEIRQLVFDAYPNFLLNGDLPLDDLEVVRDIFNELGYLDVAEAALGTVTGLAKGVFSKGKKDAPA